MQVIAINEYGNDWPVAVVAIPEGKTADQTMAEWVRRRNPSRYKDWADDKVLEDCLYVHSELPVQHL